MEHLKKYWPYAVGGVVLGVASYLIWKRYSRPAPMIQQQVAIEPFAAPTSTSQKPFTFDLGDYLDLMTIEL